MTPAGINHSATESGRCHWKGKVVMQFQGRSWVTLCAHDHRKFDKALECASEIASEIASDE